MTFENELTRAINNSFKDLGIAYRRKQAKYTDQTFDIFVDHPDNYVAIECKSIKEKLNKKLYWSSHFSDNQIERETYFLKRSGRKGYLAVELRRGRGKQKKAYLLPWDTLLKCKESSKGLSLNKIKRGKEILRRKGNYIIKDL